MKDVSEQELHYLMHVVYAPSPRYSLKDDEDKIREQIEMNVRTELTRIELKRNRKWALKNLLATN